MVKKKYPTNPIENLKKSYIRVKPDTYYSMSWNYFEDIIGDYGFKEVLSDIWRHDDKEDYFKIFADTDKSLLIGATTYNQKMNGGTLYGEIVSKEVIEEDMLNARIYDLCDILQGGSIGDSNKINEGVHFSVSIMEELIGYLKSIENSEYFKFANPWKTKYSSFDLPFLRLVTPEESKIEGYDYKAITENRIKRLPKNVREMIGVID
ncbi:MAG: hypothetical protein KAT28_03300 [Candidatus Aenigmarchaeota archaeon]|nr:hypothetical protein [Candidatus Aenigmarchaeota archaeon]